HLVSFVFVKQTLSNFRLSYQAPSTMAGYRARSQSFLKKSITRGIRSSDVVSECLGFVPLLWNSVCLRGVLSELRTIYQTRGHPRPPISGGPSEHFSCHTNRRRVKQWSLRPVGRVVDERAEVCSVRRGAPNEDMRQALI